MFLAKLGDYALRLIQNKYFWIGLFAIVAIIYISSNTYRLKRLFQGKNVDLEEGESKGLTEAKKNKIEKIGEEIKLDIYDTSWLGHNYTPYEKALDMTDQEIVYLAEHYKSYLSEKGNSLYDDIDSQYYVTNRAPAELKARLSNIGVA
jgi:hypothetical protein